MSLDGGWSEVRHTDVWTTSTILGPLGRVVGIAGIPTSTAWPTANLALFIPFQIAGPLTIAKLFFQAGVTPGTTAFDLGIYNEAGTRLASLGATSAVSTTDAIEPAGGGALASPLSIQRGRYYLAMSSAATTLTTRSVSHGNGVPRALGLRQMATAHPLPTTATFAAVSDTQIMPTLGFLEPGATIL